LTIWKKAISVATSAALLASLLATAVAPAAFAAPVTVTGAVPYVASNSEVPADGASSIVLNFGDITAGTDATTGTVTVTTTNGRFTSSFDARLVIGSTQTIATAAGPLGAVDIGALTLTAPSAAGTATVTVQVTPALGGTARTDSITTFTFTAATGTAVSTAYSTTALSASTASATGGSTGVTATTTVRDANNVAIAAGATVTWTLAGPAYFAGTLTSTSLATGVDALGVAVSPLIFSTGAAGAVTVNTSVKHLNVTYALAAKTLTLVGAPATVVASNNKYSIPTNNSNDVVSPAAGSDELFAVVSDASGQSIATGVTFTLGAYTPQNIFTVNFPVPGAATNALYDTTDKGYYIDVDCVVSGTATVTIKAAVTNSLAVTTTVTSEAVKFTCATPLSAANLGTMDLSAGSTAVAANSSVPILVTVKDKDGLPAPDGTRVDAVTNGVGTVFSSTGATFKGTVDGVARFTYFAPANSGSGTVTVFTTNTVPTSRSVTIIIGPTGAGVAIGQEESALNVTTVGPWSKSTKVAKVGKFITWKIAAGSANAGKTIGIFLQTKNSAGVWSAPVRFSARIADSRGNAYFHWKGTRAMWVSVKGGLGDIRTNPVQGRWVN